MRITRAIKMIKRSNILTKQEKKELIVKGLLESVINSYKLFLIAPFTLLRILFSVLENLFNYITEFIGIIETVFYELTNLLDRKLPELSLTKGKARDRMIQEENSGLTIVHPVDRIKEVVELEWQRNEDKKAKAKSQHPEKPIEKHVTGEIIHDSENKEENWTNSKLWNTK